MFTFLSLDIGNANRHIDYCLMAIGFLVIILCHNSRVKYDSVMGLMLLAECMPVKIMLYLMKQRIKDKKDLYLYKCKPKKYKYSCRFMKHENWRCICVKYILAVVQKYLIRPKGDDLAVLTASLMKAFQYACMRHSAGFTQWHMPHMPQARAFQGPVI